MNNMDYLKKYIEALDIVSKNRAIKVSNTNLEFVYTTESYARMFDSVEMVGKRLKDVDHPGKIYAEQLRKISLKTLETGKSVAFFVVYNFATFDSKKCFYFHVSPIINPSNQEKVGLVGELQLVNPLLVAQIFKITVPKISNHYINPQYDAISLTQREEEILFLLMLGHSYKDIAQILTEVSDKEISSSTVNTIIRRQLFKKFEADSVKELICKAAMSNLISAIPSSIIDLKEGIYEINYFED